MNINLNTATKTDILLAASSDQGLLAFLGGEQKAKDSDLDTLISKTQWWLNLNTSVGAHYGKNGF